jgi:hypothetical protein
MPPVRLLALALIGACTPAAYAPPARMVTLDSPSAPRAHDTDLQTELGHVGTIWGPSLTSGNLRARHAVSDSVVIEGETGLSRVENEGTVVASSERTSSGTVETRGSDSRNAYTGRAGVILQGVDGRVRGALTAGLGGGYSPVAGGWTSFDIGAGFGGTHRWIRPWWTGELGYNQPLSSRPFVVDYGDDEEAVLALTSNLMARSTVGLELGPEDSAFVVGLSVIRIFADTNGALDANHAQSGGDAYMSIAAGLRVLL